MSPANIRKTASDLPNTTYWKAFQGKFFGVLKWEDVDQFWLTLGVKENWYINDLEKGISTETACPEQFSAFIETAKTLINSRREMSMSGAIYADNIQSPDFVKIFDPSQMGSACNISGIRTMPRWILSRIPPEEIPAPLPQVSKPSFLGRFLNR